MQGRSQLIKAGLMNTKGPVVCRGSPPSQNFDFFIFKCSQKQLLPTKITCNCVNDWIRLPCAYNIHATAQPGALCLWMTHCMWRIADFQLFFPMFRTFLTPQFFGYGKNWYGIAVAAALPPALLMNVQVSLSGGTCNTVRCMPLISLSWKE